MNHELKNLLLPFYFGSVSEDERLLVEREILADPEVLVDYLDLKRKVEGAHLIAAQPSSSLWEKIRPKTPTQKKAWISLSLGAAIAACLALLFIFQSTTTKMVQPSANHALFDSSSELPVSSGVL